MITSPTTNKIRVSCYPTRHWKGGEVPGHKTNAACKSEKGKTYLKRRLYNHITESREDRLQNHIAKREMSQEQSAAGTGGSAREKRIVRVHLSLRDVAISSRARPTARRRLRLNRQRAQ